MILRKHWSAVLTLLAIIWTTISYFLMAPGDELGFVIMTFVIVYPLCGLLCGLWYGYTEGSRLKWLAPLFFFLLPAASAMVFFGYSFSEMDFYPCVLNTIPCLVSEIAMHIMRRITKRAEKI